MSESSSSSEINKPVVNESPQVAVAASSCTSPLCTYDSGKGRATLLIHETNGYGEFLESFLLRATRTDEAQHGRLVVIQTPRISDDTWESIAGAFVELLNEKRVRQAQVVGLGAASTLAMYLALEDSRRVRQLVLLDASSRAHPSKWARFVGRLEQYLPMGLPFRSVSKGFDATAYLQRLRCPVLVATSPRASTYEKSEATRLLAAVPTSWGCSIASTKDLWDKIETFQSVPPKCPQKNKRKGSAV